MVAFSLGNIGESKFYVKKNMLLTEKYAAKYAAMETRPSGSGRENQTDADDEDKAQDDLLEKAGGDFRPPFPP
jgi:hypothetical protein